MFIRTSEGHEKLLLQCDKRPRNIKTICNNKFCPQANTLNFTKI